jgi:predicted ATPase
LNGDIRVRLGSRALQILVMLIERAGDLVAKEELMARAWPDSCVEDNNLKVQVAALRRAFNTGSESRQFIATSNGRGYRFIAPVERAGAQIQWTGGSADARRASNNLPALSERIFGRESTVNALTAQLSRHRFITVAGTGGIGKTTVALAVAQRLLGSYHDGIWFLDLTPIRDPRLIPGALGSAFGIRIDPKDPVKDLLKSLRDRQLLLLLDGCEHLVTAVAALATQLVSTAHNAHVLVTSRECLRAPGERVHRLAPLQVPPVAHVMTAAEATAYSAVELFVERATACVEHFKLTDVDAAVVADICRKLDGLPLAIELAASRMDAFSPPELLGLLQNRRDILTQSARGALPRHQTLAAALDWSYELLSDAEKAFLRHLSVFDVPFSIDAARAVAADAAIPGPTATATLASLVSKSLVCAQSSAGKTVYRLLNTTRAYAFEKLATGTMLDTAPRRLTSHHPNNSSGKEG